MAKKTLALVDEHLDKFSTKDALLTELFSHKIVQCLAMSLDTENADTLKERQKLALELIVNLVKI